MMIKDSNHLTKQNHFHIKQVLEYVCKEELLEHIKKWLTWRNKEIIKWKHYRKSKNQTEHNSSWPLHPWHPYRILITGGSSSGKWNTFTKSNKPSNSCWKNMFTLRSLIDAPPPPPPPPPPLPLINFSKFFHPGHSYSNPPCQLNFQFFTYRTFSSVNIAFVQKTF